MNKQKRKRIVTAAVLGVWAVCSVVLAISVAAEIKSAVGFYPINGDFQNYNVFRRLLDGQVPFKDFACYLGMGVLYSCSALLALVGDTFANSVAVTHFVCVMAMACYVLAVGYCFSSNVRFSAALSCAVTAFIYGLDWWCSFLPQSIAELIRVSSVVYAFVIPSVPGNSFRPLRSFLMPLLLALFLLLCSCKRVRKWFCAQHYGVQAAVIGIVAGFCLPWSNDYGFACYGAAAITWFLILCRSRKLSVILFGSGYYTAASVGGLLLSLTVFTQGNPMAWLRTTVDTSFWQSWYFGADSEFHVLKLSQLPPFGRQNVGSVLITALFLLLLAFVVLQVLLSKRLSRFTVGRCFCFLSVFFATYLYWLKSSYDGELLLPMLQLIAFFVLFLFAQLLQPFLQQRVQDRQKKIVAAGMLLCFTGMALVQLNVAQTYFRVVAIQEENTADKYVAQLGGNLVSYYDELQLATKRLEGKTLFSTYASALECIRGEFQPSGTDYIIHALGDDARENYIAALDHGYDYIAICSRSFTMWEGWATNANWDIYRRFLPHYTYDFQHTYQVFLKADEENSHLLQAEADIRTEWVDESTVRVYVSADVDKQSVLADICVSYSTAYGDFAWKQLPLARLVQLYHPKGYLASERCDAYWLPAAAQQHYLPVELKNGEGWVELTAAPSSSAIFTEFSVQLYGLIDISHITEQLGTYAQ